MMLILIERGGKYDDVWTTHHAVSSNIEYLKGYELMLYAEREYENKIRTELLKERDNFNAAYVSPLPEPEEQKVFPRWPSGIGQHLITEAMRKERDDIKAHNAIQLDLIAKRSKLLSHAWYDHVISYLTKHYPDYDKSNISPNGYFDSYPVNYSSEFSIEPITFLE